MSRWFEPTQHHRKRKEKQNESEASLFCFYLFLFLALFVVIHTMFEFRNLEVYKKAKGFHKGCLEVLDIVPVHRTVKDQLTRASFSIALNIAEGSGRFTNPDRRNFFVISRSSVFECVAILDIMKDGGFINSNEFEKLHTQADELSRILYAMIKNLSTKK